MPRVVGFDGLRQLGVPLSKRQLDRLEAHDLFPKRVPLSAARVGWVTAEIIAYVDRCIASRSMAPGTLGSDGVVRKPPPRVAPMLGPALRANHKPEHLKAG